MLYTFKFTETNNLPGSRVTIDFKISNDEQGTDSSERVDAAVSFVGSDDVTCGERIDKDGRHVINSSILQETVDALTGADRDDHAIDERERSHKAFSLSALTYEDRRYFGTSDVLDIFIAAENEEEEERERQRMSKALSEGLDTLSETQRRRLLMLASGMRTAEIARREGASFNSVKESIAAAQKKMKKYLGSHPQ